MTRIGLIAALFASAVAGGVASRLVPVGEGDRAAPAPILSASTVQLPSLVRETAPAVVNIAVLQPSPALQNPLLRDPFFRRYMGVPDSVLQPAISAGSGVIVDGERGLVVTNFHVIQNATAVEVGLTNGRHYRAELIGAAPQLDIAVLRIDGGKHPALTLGD